MKAKAIIALLVLSWVLAGALIYVHQGRVQLIKLPPPSLAKWYKPQSERHIWLHNMFNLRREMQAVEYYANTGEAALLAEWTNGLNEHYLKIAEMVPEWAGRLDVATMDELLAAQQANQFDAIGSKLEKLQQNCKSCHDQYRTVSAALYRAPDFKDMTMDSTHSLGESMTMLNAQVNQIKIAIHAQDNKRAASALSELRSGINDTGALCISCHEHLPQEYPDASISTALDDLQMQLESGTTKQQGSALGTLAVTACAQCHGTHRIAYDMRNLLSEEPSLMELIKH